VAGLDKAFIKKAFEDVIDLSQADARVLSELALVADRLPVQSIENFKGFLGMLYFVTSHQKQKHHYLPQSLPASGGAQSSPGLFNLEH
jgi:hypothetical protein